MPPRYAYWTIIVDEQPTAFRAAAQEDLMPTFKRLKEKHASARMMWFQNGKLWPSRVDAQEAMRARGEMGRRRDSRQGGGFRDRKRGESDRPQWKPKGEFTPAPRRNFDRKPASPQARWTDRKPAGQQARKPGEKLEWRPRTQDSRPKTQDRGPKPEKRKWIPKEEYKRSKGIEAPRDSKWRPGGEHRDPKQKYKDAKKAKWGRFKQTIRKRWESKAKKKS